MRLSWREDMKCSRPLVDQRDHGDQSQPRARHCGCRLRSWNPGAAPVNTSTPVTRRSQISSNQITSNIHLLITPEMRPCPRRQSSLCPCCNASSTRLNNMHGWLVNWIPIQYFTTLCLSGHWHADMGLRGSWLRRRWPVTPNSSFFLLLFSSDRLGSVDDYILCAYYHVGHK